VLWNKSWMNVADLFVSSIISKQPVAGSIVVSTSRECVLSGVLIVNEVVPPDPHKSWPRDCVSDHAILDESSPYFLLVYAHSLILDIIDKWDIKNQRSKSCVRRGHFMIFLIFFTVLVCPRWSKYSWYQDSNLCYLSQWLRNVYVVCYICTKDNHTLQYAVLSNEEAFSLNPTFLTFACFLRSRQYAMGISILYFWCSCFLILKVS
jgi:hypothetical protein